MFKEFKCPVHGYISIDKEYCVNFIDTPIFQRLRHIEQTGMRVLYPGAHHDRFIHSIGVFHLGKLAFSYLINNAGEFLESQGISKEEVGIYEKSFLIACLLHDCGHSPFSHTLEDKYDEDDKLTKIINSLVKDESFLTDFNRGSCRPASHEKASIIVILKMFNAQIKKTCNANLLFIIRAITGCKHGSPGQDVYKRFENALISLLNSDSIDVDKLDYIMRDTWNSGINNVSIDIVRLLSSITYAFDRDGKPRLSFSKRAFSVLQNVYNGRNFLHRWVYCHHKVVYHETMIRRYVERLKELVSLDFFEALFSIESFFEPKVIQNNTIYLPTDGDLYYFLKQNIIKDSNIKSLFSHNHHKALWKSYAEYNEKFNLDDDSERRELVITNALAVLKKYCENENQIIVADNVYAKILEIKSRTVFVTFDSKLEQCIPLEDALGIQGMGLDNIPNFCYIYVSEDIMKYKQEIINEIKKLM